MKTGYICEAGYNVVNTAYRDGRELMVIVLGGYNTRERNQLSASLLSQGFANQLAAKPILLTDIENGNAGPPNMRSRICGAEKPQYQAQRLRLFNAGTEGQISYLQDKIAAKTVSIKTLGRFREVLLPPLMAQADWEKSKTASTSITADSVSVLLPPRRP